MNATAATTTTASMSMMSGSCSGGGQEALWVEEAHTQRWKLLQPRRKQQQRVVLLNDELRVSAARKLFAQGNADAAFHQALVARRAMEGGGEQQQQHAELLLLLQDAVQKGKNAAAVGNMERAKDLLEFILPPATTVVQQQPSAAEADETVVSSLGFDKSFDAGADDDPTSSPTALLLLAPGVRLSTKTDNTKDDDAAAADVLSMSSLNEILDGPLTPTPKQTKRFPFRLKKQQEVIDPLDVDTRHHHRDDTAAKFITTIVICEGTEPSVENVSFELSQHPTGVADTVDAEEEEDKKVTTDNQDDQADAADDEEEKLGNIEDETREGVQPVSPSVSEVENREEVDEDEAIENSELLNESQIETVISDASVGETMSVDESSSSSYPVTTLSNLSPLKHLSPFKRLLRRKKSNEPLSVVLIESPTATEKKILVSLSGDDDDEASGHLSDRYAAVLEESQQVDATNTKKTTIIDNHEDKYSIPTDPCTYCDAVWGATPTTVLTVMDEQAEPSSPCSVPTNDKYGKHHNINTNENDIRPENHDDDESTKDFSEDEEEDYHGDDQEEKMMGDTTLVPLQQQRSKKRFALFRRKVTAPTTRENPSILVKEVAPLMPSSCRRPVQGILKSSSMPSKQHMEYGHDDQPNPVEEEQEATFGDPLLDRLRRRGLEPSEPQAPGLDP